MVVTKPGYVTHVFSHAGSAGGSQTLNIVLQALPTPLTTQTITRTPTAAESGRPEPTPSTAPKLMRYDTATGQFTESLTGLDSNRMTVVISHGWLSRPETWARPLAQLINDHHALGTPPNIVAWDWHNQTSFSKKPTPSTDAACLHGIKLGEQLRLALGTGYSQHLHFIGHSLGAIVNSYAVRLCAWKLRAEQQ